MTTFSHLRLRAVGAVSGEPTFIDVPESGALRVRAIPGATGIHIAIHQAESVVFRGEVECSPEDVVRLDVVTEADGGLTVRCPGKDVYTLPLASPEPRVAVVAGGAKALDIVFVVDATARHCRVEPGGHAWSLGLPLLSHPEEWQRHVAELVELFTLLVARHPNVRAEVIAFGDEPLPEVSARDLTAGQYKLWPDARRLRPCTASSLGEMLAAVPPSAGADFVDALADGLDACAALNFRDDARKLVVLTGDSPGLSLLFPPPPGLQLDAHIRELDVDTVTLRLFEMRGVEVATIYHDVPRESGYLDDPRSREAQALALARAQYARLASRPELAFKRSRFSAERVAEVLSGSRVFGLKACLPAVLSPT